jgi:hypothetical protein
MKNINNDKLLASILIMIFFCNSLNGEDNEYTNKIMNGISNNGQNLKKEYLTPGDRTYIIGTQDGNFPDLGGHVKGEMGGVWIHPIKLIDGFWVKLADSLDSSETWLEDAKEFINYPYGNKFIYEPILNGIQVERLQFCPQGKKGVVVEYIFKNTSNRSRKINVDFVIKTDLSPVWFSKENNIIDAVDTVYWDRDKSVFIARDSLNPWFSIWGSSLISVGHKIHSSIPIETIGLGMCVANNFQIDFTPYESVTAIFVVSGSDQSLADAMATYDDISNNYDDMLADKKAHYEKIINCAKVNIPDKKLQQAYNWGKMNTDWLIMELPDIGRFLGAGAIEYPWLFGCDNAYALQGVVATGNLELAKSTLRVIKDISEKINGNGRIIHEMSSNGFVYNKGNTQETAHFAVAVWKIFQWTGDKEFLGEMYPYIKKGINWLFTEQDRNGNMFPEGYGIMEVKGLNAELIDVAVYAQQALTVASKMAAIFNEPDLQKEYAQKAKILKNKINTEFWNEDEGSYCDFYGTREQAILVAQGALEQSNISEKQEFYKGLIREFSELPPGTQKGWFTNKNWVISTPIETGIAPETNAIKLLDKVKNEHCGEFGPYLSAVDRENMMTISTSVQAVAECQYGHTDEALWYVDKIVSTFSNRLPGSFSEMMPDYGCPVQAWTIYGLAVPLVTHIFGINPNAYDKTIDFIPHFPSNWNNGSISSLPIGSNKISLFMKKTDTATEYSIISEMIGWKLVFKIKDLKNKEYFLNDKRMIADSDEIIVYGENNKIILPY